MRALRLVIVTLLLALTGLAATVSAEQPASPVPPPYRVIVHPRNPITSVDSAFLRDAFLKKTTRWPNDKTMHPADLAARASARTKFSEEVLRRSVAAVIAYWQQQIFSGRGVPPPEFESDEKVVAYVLKHEGAVGYVSGTAKLGAAKPISVNR
jgi:ABC-type phosphate transport system substrate-binding protein